MILYQSGRNSIKYVITQLQRPLVKVLLIPYDDVWRLDRRVLITGIGDPLKNTTHYVTRMRNVCRCQNRTCRSTKHWVANCTPLKFITILIATLSLSAPLSYCRINFRKTIFTSEEGVSRKYKAPLDFN